MQSQRDIKRRIRSVENIAQITKAMEVVSMNKMRRSQTFALAARPYALASLDMLKNLLTMTEDEKLPGILKQRIVRRRALLVVTADKGLVGGFNDTLLRKAEQWIARQPVGTYHLITVGKRAKEHFERRNVPIEKSYIGFGDFTDFSDTLPVAKYVLEGYETKTWDAVDMIYTHFKTTLKQETMERKLLPTTEPALEEFVREIVPEYGRFSELRTEEFTHPTRYNYSYTFEPTPEKILSRLVPTLLQVVLHHVMLESNASEHSARMVTMKQASDNATDLEGRLTLQFNKARQAGITAEISEIIAGAEALK